MSSACCFRLPPSFLLDPASLPLVPSPPLPLSTSHAEGDAAGNQLEKAIACMQSQSLSRFSICLLKPPSRARSLASSPPLSSFCYSGFCRSRFPSSFSLSCSSGTCFLPPFPSLTTRLLDCATAAAAAVVVSSSWKREDRTRRQEWQQYYCCCCCCMSVFISSEGEGGSDPAMSLSLSRSFISRLASRDAREARHEGRLSHADADGNESKEKEE